MPSVDRSGGPVVWVLRSGADSERDAWALKNGFAGGGWHWVPSLEGVTSRRQVADIVRPIHPGGSNITQGIHIGELWRICGEIQVGDIMVMPRPNPRSIAIGRVTAGYRYLADEPDSKRRHVIGIDWIRRQILREELGADLDRVLNVGLTIFVPSGSAAQERLRAILDTGVDPSRSAAGGAALAAALAVEVARRSNMELQLGGGDGPWTAEPSQLNSARIFLGGRSIYFDKQTTESVANPGVAVSVLHTGSSYADDLSDDSLIYHYPTTLMPGKDAGEIEAVKNARRLNLPLFTIVSDGPRRIVRRSWVTDWNDENKTFLITFASIPPDPASDEEPPENVIQPRQRQQRSGSGVIRDPRFRYRVLKRYGSKCGACDVTRDEMLHAAHIIPVADGGVDHPANGIPLCLNHHAAFDDKRLPLSIHPQTLEWQLPDGVALPALYVTRPNIEHLREVPDIRSLQRHWDERYRDRGGVAGKK